MLHISIYPDFEIQWLWHCFLTVQHLCCRHTLLLFTTLPQLSSATHIALKLRLQSDNESAVAWLEWYLSRLMSCLFSLCTLQWECVECCDWCVFLCECVFRDTPSPKLGMQVFLCVSLLQSLTFSHSLFSFPSYFPSLMSASFLLLLLLLLYSPSLSSHRDCVHSCQEGRRCLWSRLDKDQASPSCCPHPLPGKMGAPSLAGHRLPFECAASRGSGDLTWFVSLLLRVCPEPLAPTPITKGLVSWYRSGVWGG